MSDILVIGSLNMDMTLFTERFPQVGETLPCESMMTAPGGKGANQALAAARLGGQVSMLGCVGCDANGGELLDELRQGGVDTSLVRRLPDINTGLAVITVSEGSNMILISAGANAQITPQDIDAIEDEIAAVKAVVLQLEIPMAAVVRAAQLARRHGCTVVLNPAPYHPLPDELLALVDYLIPNETETMSMLGLEHLDEHNAEAALRMMAGKGVPFPVITMGDKGVAFLHNGAFYMDPCNRVKAVDTTAAGDTFIGGLISSLLKGAELPDAVRYAQRASAYCVAHKGAQTSIPTAEILEQWQPE